MDFILQRLAEHTCTTSSESLRTKAPREVGQRTGIVDFRSTKTFWQPII